MNIATLSTLVAILERGSFVAAARDVGCTPSAVSLQVKQLESYFGRPLFDRSTRSVKPTPFALQAAEVVSDLAGRLEALRARPLFTVQGRIRLGAIATVQTGGLPTALRMARDRYPALEVQVSLDDSDALLAGLKADRIDLAVLVRPQSGGSSRLAWRNLATQPFVMLVPPEAKGASPGEMLRRFGLIRYDTTLTGGRIAARYVRSVFPQARCVMEIRSIDAIVAMVAAGLGVSIVPQPRRALLEAHAVREMPLGRDGPRRQISVARRHTDSENRNIDAFIGCLASAYGSAARSD